MLIKDEISVTADGRVTFEDAARFLGFSMKTLEGWRGRGYGPQAYKIGGKLFYKLSELESFIADQSLKSVVDDILKNRR